MQANPIQSNKPVTKRLTKSIKQNVKRWNRKRKFQLKTIKNKITIKRIITRYDKK